MLLMSKTSSAPKTRDEEVLRTLVEVSYFGLPERFVSGCLRIHCFYYISKEGRYFTELSEPVMKFGHGTEILIILRTKDCQRGNGMGL